MAKKKISLKEVLQDIRSGMDDHALMEKHELSAKQLQILFQKVVEKGALSQDELDSRRPSAPPPLPRPAATTASLPPQQVRPKQPSPKALPQEDSDEPVAGRRRWRIPYIKIAIVVLIVGFVLMVKFLPWYVSVAAIVVGVPAVIWLVKFLTSRFFLGAFKTKGRVLAGAEAVVHGIRPANAPKDDDDEDDDEDYEKYRRQFTWYHVDVTIRPKPQSGGRTHWEPGEITLVGMDAKPEDMGEDNDELAEIADYKIFVNGKFCEDEGGKHVGPQRIEFLVGVKPGLKTLQFRYYFELFGTVSFAHG